MFKWWMPVVSVSLLLFSSTWNMPRSPGLQARGFVNYYGPQRFGSGQSVQSDRVGLALLKEDMVSVNCYYPSCGEINWFLEAWLSPTAWSLNYFQKEEQCHLSKISHIYALSDCTVLCCWCMFVMYVVVCGSGGRSASLLHSRGRRWSSEPRKETLPPNRWEQARHWPL